MHGLHLLATLICVVVVVVGIWQSYESEERGERRRTGHWGKVACPDPILYITASNLSSAP